ncbi:MAG TPA: hypothetical protein ENH94_06845 [Phycisphaerales bacterium]|nr:hypothetical protein [Phycisphaerales bacterium]
MSSVNSPPVMAPVNNMTVTENTLVSFSVNASDPDGDSVTITGDNLPAGSDLTDGAFSWTPAADQIGDNIMSFIASDGQLEDIETVTITVTAKDVPQPEIGPLVGAWKFDVGNAGSVEDLSGNGSTATINGATWTGQNELNFDGLNDYVNCGNSAALNLTSNLTISAWINPRTFGQANYARIVDKGTSSTGFSLLIDGNSGVLKYAVYGKAITASNPNVIDLNVWQHVAATYNDSADLVSFYVNGQPAGTAVCTTGPLDSSANPLYIGIRSYDKNRAFDGLIDDVRMFNKALTGAEIAGLYDNHKTLFDPIGNRTVNENETLTINVAASVTVTAQPLPTGATFVGNTFAWTPTSDQAGTYIVTFTATDGAASDSETVTITVNNVNRPPVVAPIGNMTVDEEQAVSFDVTATDADGDTLTLSAADLPQGASFANGTFAWTPADGQAGAYTVTFTATDGAASDSETVTITVNNVNRPPVVDPIGNKVVDEGQAVSFDVTATDADGDTLTLSAANLPQGASFTNATFAWTPADGQAGTYTVIFTATDATASDSETVTITVNAKANTDNGFAGAWRFNVNGAASTEDISGNGSTATIHGATWNGRDELSFDGTNDYVNCGNSGDLNLTSSLTISAWINPRSFGQRNFGRIVDKGTSSTGFSLLVDGKSAALKYAVYGKAIVKSNPNVIDLNMWQHVAATYNESAELVSFYVNGQPAGTAVCTTNPLDSSANPLFIGIRGYDQSRAFDGIIDDVCTFSKALTGDEIAALHSTGVEVAIAYSVK